MEAAEALRAQGRACAALGSPMYADLLARLADDCAAGGPTARVLRDHQDVPGPTAVALRLLGSVHRLVLERRAGALALSWPSVGGTWEPGTGAAAVLALLEERPDEVRARLDRPPQTNEVGRACALLGGLLHLPDALRLPVRLVELGASAGLNLLADRFVVTEGPGPDGAGGRVLQGDPASGVRLEGAWAGRELRPWPGLEVVERLGCDPHPVDPTTTEGRLALTAYVWPDQVHRLERLRGALAVAADHPVDVRRSTAAELVDALELREGCTTVVWHSVMWQYLDAAEQDHVVRRLEELGRAAGPHDPLVHLALEPRRRGAGTPHDFWVVLRTWPGPAEEVVIGRSVAHGMPTTWL